MDKRLICVLAIIVYTLQIEGLENPNVSGNPEEHFIAKADIEGKLMPLFPPTGGPSLWFNNYFAKFTTSTSSTTTTTTTTPRPTSSSSTPSPTPTPTPTPTPAPTPTPTPTPTPAPTQNPNPGPDNDTPVFAGYIPYPYFPSRYTQPGPGIAYGGNFNQLNDLGYAGNFNQLNNMGYGGNFNRLNQADGSFGPQQLIWNPPRQQITYRPVFIVRPRRRRWG